jgi:hypothetical protein
MPSRPQGPLIIACGCSDFRLDPWFAALTEYAASVQGRVFPVRMPGGAAIFALHWRIVWFLQAIFRKGARIVVLQNHHDCAWVAETIQSRKGKLLLRALRFGSVDQFHQWLLDRATRNIERFARRRGWSTYREPVLVLAQLVPPDYREISDDIRATLKARP